MNFKLYGNKIRFFFERREVLLPGIQWLWIFKIRIIVGFFLFTMYIGRLMTWVDTQLY